MRSASVPLRLVAVSMTAGCSATQTPPVDLDSGPDGASEVAKDVSVPDALADDDGASDPGVTPDGGSTCAMFGGCSDANAPDCPGDPVGAASRQDPCAEEGGTCSYLGRCMPSCSCTHGHWVCQVPAC